MKRSTYIPPVGICPVCLTRVALLEGNKIPFHFAGQGQEMKPCDGRGEVGTRVEEEPLKGKRHEVASDAGQAER